MVVACGGKGEVSRSYSSLDDRTSVLQLLNVYSFVGYQVGLCDSGSSTAHVWLMAVGRFSLSVIPF